MYGDFYECILYFGNHKTSVGHLRNVKKHHEYYYVYRHKHHECRIKNSKLEFVSPFHGSWEQIRWKCTWNTGTSGLYNQETGHVTTPVIKETSEYFKVYFASFADLLIGSDWKYFDIWSWMRFGYLYFRSNYFLLCTWYLSVPYHWFHLDQKVSNSSSPSMRYWSINNTSM